MSQRITSRGRLRHAAEKGLCRQDQTGSAPGLAAKASKPQPRPMKRAAGADWMGGVLMHAASPQKELAIAADDLRFIARIIHQRTGIVIPSTRKP